MTSRIRIVRPAVIALCLGTAFAMSAPAFANFGAPAPSTKCKQFKKGSPEWKGCMGKLRLEEDEMFALGYWLAKTGDYDGALAAFASMKNQGSARVLTMAGYATRHLGRVDDALMLYGKALAANPNRTDTRQYLGEAYLQKGDTGKAKTELAEIARLCGSTACQDYQKLSTEITAFEAKS